MPHRLLVGILSLVVVAGCSAQQSVTVVEQLEITSTTTTHAPDDVDDFFATVPRVGLRSGVRIGRHVLRRGGFGFTFFFSDAGDDEREEKARDAFAGERKARANERDEQRNARKIERSGIVEG